MKVRARLDRIEKAAGVSRCPHCKALLPGREESPPATAEGRARYLDEMLGQWQRRRPEDPPPHHANAEPTPETIGCPHCGGALPPQGYQDWIAPVHEIVAAVIRHNGRVASPR